MTVLSLLTFFSSLIAIMLGRLNMDVNECIEVYKDLMGSIFGSKAHWLPITASANVTAQYDAKRVKAAIEEVLRKHNLPEDAVFNDGIERRCKVYVSMVLSPDSTDLYTDLFVA